VEASISICVDFPAPSPPSNVMKIPRFTQVLQSLDLAARCIRAQYFVSHIGEEDCDSYA
jgi:hypothetical protein